MEGMNSLRVAASKPRWQTRRSRPSSVCVQRFEVHQNLAESGPEPPARFLCVFPRFMTALRIAPRYATWWLPTLHSTLNSRRRIRSTMMFVANAHAGDQGLAAPRRSSPEGRISSSDSLPKRCSPSLLIGLVFGSTATSITGLGRSWIRGRSEPSRCQVVWVSPVVTFFSLPTGRYCRLLAASTGFLSACIWRSCRRVPSFLL